MNKETLRVFVLFGNSASSIRYLCEHDRNFGVKYEVVGALTDNPDATAIKFFFNTIGHCKILTAHNLMPKNRSKYYEKAKKIIDSYQPDLIICSGWMWIIAEPLLSSYAGKIINVHPADLSIVSEEGIPKYRGKNAVEKAILSGERELRSTIHYVSKEVDCGKIICLSPHIFHVQLNKTPNWHQEQMKLICDGPAMRFALEKLTSKVPQNS